MGSPNRSSFTLSDDKEGTTEYDFGLGLKMMMMANHETSKSVDFSGDRDTDPAGGCSGGADFGALLCSSNSDSWGGRLFTSTQRQELERQTIIYKYMAANIPVPVELLTPMSSKHPSIDNGTGCGNSALNVKYAGRSRDQEPWRCKRTDGKKWRCAKDAAPDQRYCERHSHKGRLSRSRKHVESSPTSSTSTRRANNKNTSTSSSNSSAVNPTNISINPPFLYQASPAMFMSQHHLSPSQYSNSRSSDWFLKREADNAQSTANVPTASPFFGVHQMPPEHSHPTRASSSEFMLSLGDRSVGIGEITGKSAASDSSLLTLSMAGGGVYTCKENEDADARLGMGLYEPERHDDISGGVDERYAWMGSLAPGGPLAEALCLGIIGADSAQGGADGYHGHGGSWAS